MYIVRRTAISPRRAALLDRGYRAARFVCRLLGRDVLVSLRLRRR